MSNSSKGFVPILILLMVFAIGGYLAYINYQQNRAKVNTFQEVPQLSSADWETYSNKEYGFEFRYDRSSKIYVLEKTGQPSEPYLLLVSLDNPNLIETRVDETGKTYESHDSERYFYLEVRSNIKGCLMNKADLRNEKGKKISISNILVEIIEQDVAYNGHRRSFCVKNGGMTYWFEGQYYNGNSDKVKDKSRQLFDQVISTFKFTDK